MSRTNSAFTQAREAAILIPKNCDHGLVFPEGSAVLAPLDEQGSMYPMKDGLIVCMEDGTTHSPHQWDFLNMAANAALGIRYPQRYASLGTCSANDIRMVAIYDLDRQVIIELLQASLLEDWTEEDRDDLMPPRVASGTRDASTTQQLVGSGKSLLHKDPGIVQFRNGQVLIQTGTMLSPVIFDHDDQQLIDTLAGVDLPVEVRRRIFGRSPV